MTPTLDALVRQLRVATDAALVPPHPKQALANEWKPHMMVSPHDMVTLLDALTAAQGHLVGLCESAGGAEGDAHNPADCARHSGITLDETVARAEQAEAEAARLREQVRALTERTTVWPAVLKAAIADVWEARAEAEAMHRSWRQAERAMGEADKENDRHIAKIVELEAQVSALQGELAEARGMLATADCMTDRYHKERDAAREALRQVEYPHVIPGYCPWCLAYDPQHAPTCARQAALGQPAEPPPVPTPTTPETSHHG